MMFSIVMPLFNKAHTIERTVASVFGQTYLDFELIIVDDGSTDDGPARLALIRDPRISLLRTPNQGPGLARNVGAAKAKFDWIAFLDADDHWLPDHLAELNRVRTAYPNAGVIATDWVEAHVEGDMFPGWEGGPASGRGTVNPLGAEQAEIVEIDYFRRASERLGTVWSSSAAVRRDVFFEVGGFIDQRVGEDLELWAKIALDYPVAVSSRITAIYVRGTGGIMDTVSNPWSSREIRTIADVSPAMALLAVRHPDGSGLQSESLERYVDATLTNCLRILIYNRDLSNARRLKSLYRRRLPLLDRALLLIAALPFKLAHWIIDLAMGVYLPVRRAGRRSGKGSAKLRPPSLGVER